ncbi:MAG: hypothetical protein COU90_03575 [Candidatus Ryanbacteria bacterium CG10_big_fil_rev_8_21_14_0_10_43_42]|uniref:Uncharacterized protein n=1 Tax=Candidatus Ryanbacteria bacterium CG10_big_fil_rev_8_21_14_0_10_43_42 TaxID=1974864 RepID=A0A2M8KWH5_9BACT|nr:MAG: hypothetical protein COU90_03575 [Candidatus Ryanbacteria bacterium CG10_big_fil_rev_8_21_14_0_10_43_42]
MIEKNIKLYKVKEGKEQTLTDWGNTLMNERKDEAIATLKEEQCLREFLTMFTIDNSSYIAIIMQGDNILPSTNKEINQTHKKIIRECTDGEITLRTLYDIRVD